LPNTCLRSFTCRSAPVTAEDFPDESESAWPNLCDDDDSLQVLWSPSVHVTPSERHSHSTGQFDWPSMPSPHVVQSQMKFGATVCHCILCCLVLICFVLFCFVLFCIVLFCFVCFGLVLCCGVLFYFVLFHIFLNSRRSRIIESWC
jgi:hypothetical protein